jgi:hypothetical protein
MLHVPNNNEDIADQDIVRLYDPESIVHVGFGMSKCPRPANVYERMLLEDDMCC